MTDMDPLMDDEQAGEAVAKYLEDHPELLQGITPANDLWPAIESRISARVIPMSQRPVHASRRSLGWIPTLIAASGLIVASAGVTYVLTKRGAAPYETSGSVASNGVTAPSTTTAAPSDTQTVQTRPAETSVAHNDVNASENNDSQRVIEENHSSARLASHPVVPVRDEMRKTYDSEIATLHDVLDARRGQLNPSTVATIEQNLLVIDEAIRQSKAALAKDPNSRLLNEQLDRTLAKKTGLLRAAALLPSA
jgi:hypothetical protein